MTVVQAFGRHRHHSIEFGHRARCSWRKNIPRTVDVPEEQEGNPSLLPRHLDAHEARAADCHPTEVAYSGRCGRRWPKPFLHHRTKGLLRESHTLRCGIHCNWT